MIVFIRRVFISIIFVICIFNISAADSDETGLMRFGLFVGSNDVRDALVSQDLTIIECALNSIYINIMTLISAGATDFLIPNVPNLGMIPAVTLQGEEAKQGATWASGEFNRFLEGMLSNIEAAYGQQSIAVGEYGRYSQRKRYRGDAHPEVRPVGQERG